MEQFADTSLASDSLGNILKIIYLGFEKSQNSVTHDFLRHRNILTYLLTYVSCKLGRQIGDRDFECGKNLSSTHRSRDRAHAQ